MGPNSKASLPERSWKIDFLIMYGAKGDRFQAFRKRVGGLNLQI